MEQVSGFSYFYKELWPDEKKPERACVLREMFFFSHVCVEMGSTGLFWGADTPQLPSFIASTEL